MKAACTSVGAASSGVPKRVRRVVHPDREGSQSAIRTIPILSWWPATRSAILPKTRHRALSMMEARKRAAALIRRDGTMSDKRTWALGVFGDSIESGQWKLGAKIRAIAVFGDSTLDMSQAITSADEINVRAVAGFGDVRVIVPAGSQVEISGLALFGSKRSEVTVDPKAGGPVVRVKAWALFGDVTVA